MAMVIQSSLCSVSFQYLYPCPSVILPRTLRIRSRDTDSSGSSNSIRRKSDDTNSGNSRLSVLYGDDYGKNTVQGQRYPGLIVRAASKRPRNGGEEEYEEEQGYKREEERWLREEQRWLREEQRWLRQEARWNAERDSLLRQISSLSLKIQDLEMELEGIRNRVGSASTVSETLGKITSMLQVLNTNQNRIAEYSGESSKPLILEHAELESDSQSEVHDPVPPPAAAIDPAPTPTPILNSESKKKADNEQKPQRKKSSALSLKMGSEGEEVQSMQEALLSLGFYCGEDDMEYSCFDSGTLRAVKTWQSSIDVREDGIMTAELLQRLYASQQSDSSESSVNSGQDVTIPKQDNANGASAASMTKVQQADVNKGPADAYTSQHRVFLLGENRWEEPSRLKKGNDKQITGVGTQASVIKCITCRGEGRLLCMECDGTGEPNIEPQFMEWVEEGTKCPYCEGRGYNVCDVCEGNATA